MSEAAPTAYDAVAYPSAIFSQTAPDRLAVIARLAGLSPHRSPARACWRSVGATG